MIQNLTRSRMANSERLTCRSPIAKRGFTLIEMVISLGISAILVAGLTSLLTIGLKAAASSPNGIAKQRSADLVDQVITDLANARSFDIVSPSEVSFQVPHRSGQQSLESVSYRWQASSNKQLLQSYNGGDFQVIAENVETCEFTYVTRDWVNPVPPTGFLPESLFAEYDSRAGTVNHTVNITSSQWAAQRFTVPFHPEAVSWSPSRIALMIQRNNGQPGQFEIRLQPVNPITGRPEPTIAASLTAAIQHLPGTLQWTEFIFPPSQNLDPHRAYAIVIAAPTVTGTLYPRIQTQTGLMTLLPGGFYSATTDAGSSWTWPSSITSVQFRLHGTVTTQVWK